MFGSHVPFEGSFYVQWSPETYDLQWLEMLLNGVKLTKMSRCGSGFYTEVNGPPLVNSGWASTAPPCGPVGSDNTGSESLG